jgi:FAD-dependent urate hydroxylase
LVKRLGKIPIRLGRSIASVTTVGERSKVRFDDGGERIVQHVVLGTGYRVDISKYAFLAPALVESIQRVDGYPVLQAGLEASIPGLHILGASAAWSFGPLMQFVSGTHFGSRALIRRISGKTAE